MDCPSTDERVTTLAGELAWHHEDNYVVWNVAGTSEAPYDPAAFGGRVVQLKFPGYLGPPLLMLVEACASIHAWLRADPANYVAIHCRSGRGRSALVLSCVLAFLAVHGGHGPAASVDWLSHLALLRGQEEADLTLPTHRRYLQYFDDLMRNGAPRASSDQDGCELRSVVLHGLPALDPPPCIVLSFGQRAVFVSSNAQVAELPDGEIELNGESARCMYSFSGSQRSTAAARGDQPTWPVLRGDLVLTVREESRI